MGDIVNKSFSFRCRSNNHQLFVSNLFANIPQTDINLTKSATTDTDMAIADASALLAPLSDHSVCQ